MNPKSQFAIIVPLVGTVMLLLAPTVNSCVNFQAWWDAASGPDAFKMTARLWDNDRNNPVCSADGVYVNSDGSDPYLTLSCVEGYTAVFDTINNYDVAYNTPHGGYPFNAEWQGTDDTTGQWYTCAFCDNSSECFVPTS